MAAGLGLGIGLVLLALAFLAPRPADGPAPPRPRRRPSRTVAVRAAAGLALGLAGLLATGFAAAVPAGVAAALGLPLLLAPHPNVAGIARLDALQEWTRGMASALTVGMGIEQAVAATARSAPAPIRPQVTSLAAALTARTPAPAALRRFADDLADPAGDLIVAALLLGAARRGQGMASVLNNLAASLADEARIRRAVDADQAKIRSAARLITIITLLMMGGLFAAGGYTAPYGTPAGQAVLLLLLAAYAGCLAWLRRIAAGRPLPRLIEGGTA
jgi:Flp pilus assembly protein TadB